MKRTFVKESLRQSLRVFARFRWFVNGTDESVPYAILTYHNKRRSRLLHSSLFTFHFSLLFVGALVPPRFRARTPSVFRLRRNPPPSMREARRLPRYFRTTHLCRNGTDESVPYAILTYHNKTRGATHLGFFIPSAKPTPSFFTLHFSFFIALRRCFGAAVFSYNSSLPKRNG